MNIKFGPRDIMPPIDGRFRSEFDDWRNHSTQHHLSIEGKTVGAVMISGLHKYPNGDYKYAPGITVKLYCLQIFKPYQGNGYGELLMERIEQYCGSLGVDTIDLEVLYDNNRAISLYHKIGYKVIYDDGYEGYGMRKRVRPKYRVRKTYNDENYYTIDPTTVKRGRINYKIGAVDIAGAYIDIYPNNIVVFDVAVHEKFRKKGWGWLLMQDIISFAKVRKVPKITLNVLASNTPALNLYKSVGFEISGQPGVTTEGPILKMVKTI